VVTNVIIIIIVTYLLIPRSRILLEMVTNSQLVPFPACYETRKFVNALIRARYLSLS